MSGQLRLAFENTLDNKASNHARMVDAETAQKLAVNASVFLGTAFGGLLNAGERMLIITPSKKARKKLNKHMGICEHLPYRMLSHEKEHLNAENDARESMRGLDMVARVDSIIGTLEKDGGVGILYKYMESMLSTKSIGSTTNVGVVLRTTTSKFQTEVDIYYVDLTRYRDVLIVVEQLNQQITCNPQTRVRIVQFLMGAYIPVPRNAAKGLNMYHLIGQTLYDLAGAKIKDDMNENLSRIIQFISPALAKVLPNNFLDSGKFHTIKGKTEIYYT